MAALVCGIVGLIGACFWGLGAVIGIAGVVCGLMARSRIRAAGGARSGEGMALAGIITGAIATVLGAALFALMVWSFSQSGY